MEIFKAIIEFIKDNSIKKLSKFFIFLTVVIFFVFADNIFGFSYYYNLNNKLSQIEKVSNILNNSTLDFATRNELSQIRKDIIGRKTLKDDIISAWRKISFTDSNDKILNELNSSSKIRNSTIEFISINYFWIFLFIFMPLYAFINPFSEFFLEEYFIIIGRANIYGSFIILFIFCIFTYSYNF
ncbi:hypothetical protein [Flavobacterium nitrogenifigens]|uniref:Uncharacterized protein n=1 Tax=Flavobacterium nitrogenifigens TaxID=1617283 RepID=A0A521AJ34_9FLAO|nr:hypothetical protein [Flavobacterium nitrogenifigens]KAF2331586.1 hypothetical protein DM397_12690 [Flavobacterium nitrogenifigens]SMO34768.1 hypothetical protein SAMN06265220_101191 [Flavobacterium nitrogenifigens]